MKAYNVRQETTLMSTDVDTLSCGHVREEQGVRKEYVFSAMSWLSVVIISCWLGWLLGSGCGISSIQDQRSAAELPSPRSSQHGAAAVHHQNLDLASASRPAEPPAEDVTVDSTLDQAAEALAQESERPVILTPEAERIAHCVTLPLSEPGASSDGAQHRVRSSIEAAGFTIVEGEAGQQIVPARDVMFLGCTSRMSSPLPERGELRAIRARVRQISRRERELPREDFVKLALLSRTAPRDERFVPYVREGEMLGVKLYRTEEQGLSQMFGFNDGDVITHVAGQSLSTPGSAVRLSPDENKVIVRVLRAGEPVVLQYNLVQEPRPSGARDVR